MTTSRRSPASSKATGALARLLGLTALLAALAVVLVAAGEQLPMPPHHPASAVAWWQRHDPVVAVAAIARVLALAVVVHLGTTTMVGAIAAAVRSRRLAAIAQRLSPRAWATVLRPLVIVAGVTVTPVGHASAGPAAAVTVTADPDPTPFELRLSPSPSMTGWEMTLLGPDPAATPTGPSPSGPTPAATPGPDAVTTAPGPDDLAVAPLDPDPASETADLTRFAAPGDSLWSLSADRLAEVAGRAVTPGEVAPYWRDVIAANAATIPDPGLVFVGQAVRLPAPQLP